MILVCAACGLTVPDHCRIHVVPCCPGRCPGRAPGTVPYVRCAVVATCSRPDDHRGQHGGYRRVT